jgi:hypothetical protein
MDGNAWLLEYIWLPSDRKFRGLNYSAYLISTKGTVHPVFDLKLNDSIYFSINYFIKVLSSLLLIYFNATL